MKFVQITSLFDVSVKKICKAKKSPTFAKI